jgi:hypothetical protein
MVGNDGRVNYVWEYTGSGTDWTPVTTTNTSFSQFAVVGSELFILVNIDGGTQVWEYGGYGTYWILIPGSNFPP